jgi:phosphoribosylglycinamide formyltransferase-1
MSAAPLAIAVLISGTGSNLKTLITANENNRLNLVIRLVISNRPEAPGLEHARKAGIPICIINKNNSDNPDRDIEIRLHESGVELVILAGYMRIVGKELVDAFAGRLINLHPSLLPKHPGLNTYQQVLDSGDAIHGASIHFVTAVLDGGPVISQVRIPVLEEDDANSLSARLGPKEHSLLVATVELLSERQVEIRSGTVHVNGQCLDKPLQLNDGDIFD